MGYFTELNTMLGLPQGFDTKKLEVGKRFKVVKERERAFPLRLAVLIATFDWNFIGYAMVYSVKNKDKKVELEFEVLTLFSLKEQRIYKTNFLKAARKTGEI
jgi:hypothetical protein